MNGEHADAQFTSCPAPDTLRIYDSLRTIHLERFRSFKAADVLYRHRRYDFDIAEIDPANPPRQVTQVQTLSHLLRHSYRTVEINEPLMSRLWPQLLSDIAAAKIRALLTHGHTSVVTYCIGVDDPARELAKRRFITPRTARVITPVVMNVLVLGMDRIAFGTRTSLNAYLQYVRPQILLGRSRIFEALPEPCACMRNHWDDRKKNGVLFVGAFEKRKGVDEVMSAWDAVEHTRPQARLSMLGKGKLYEEVRAWAATRPHVVIEADPTRGRIHKAQRESKVAILLSQPWRGWREQVGLPVVEGLAHGCEIVSSTETGLAAWLSDHDHQVTRPDASADTFASLIVHALDKPRTAREILESLPSVDQRRAADVWLTE